MPVTSTTPPAIPIPIAAACDASACEWYETALLHFVLLGLFGFGAGGAGGLSVTHPPPASLCNFVALLWIDEREDLRDDRARDRRTADDDP